jgi:pilus assembly protein CpaB
LNPRQRRGVLLLVLAAAGAITVFFAVSSYVSDVRSQVEPLVTVLQLKEDVEPYLPIDDSELEEFELPRRWAPDTALRDRSESWVRCPHRSSRAGRYCSAGCSCRSPSSSPASASWRS